MGKSGSSLSMFRGANSISLDSKGRMVLPTKYREQLTEDTDFDFILTIDIEDTCLLLYPLEQWESIEGKIQALPSLNMDARRVQRLLIGHAHEAKLDGQGRILIPGSLREFAKIGKNIMLVGQGKKFEIWDESTWVYYRETHLLHNNETPNNEIPQELKNLSL